MKKEKKKIIISASMKSINLIKKTIENLEKLGHDPIFPNLEYVPKNGKSLTSVEKKELAMAHYKAIDKADIMYVIVENGYMGTSVKLELGYAFALKMPIFYSQKAEDGDLNFYYDDIVEIENLDKISQKV